MSECYFFIYRSRARRWEMETVGDYIACGWCAGTGSSYSYWCCLRMEEVETWVGVFSLNHW